MRRSSRAAVQDSSKATVSLRNQDLHMKAQPKQPRVPRVQKRDRLLDVPLTQEWLASSGQMTSCAKQPGSSGHEKPQPKVLFRDHELVWAKVRLPRGICVAPLTHWPGSRVKLPPLSPQVKGSPWWPAVVCPDANGHTQRGRQYHVAFFGEDQTEGYCMPDNMCNFELNLGNFNASMTARGSRKRQAAIDDALAELQRREHAQASLTATRSTASSRSPAVPRKRAKTLKTTLPLSGKDDVCAYGAQQSVADVLELLQQAAVEVESKEKDLHKSERKNILNFVTPPNLTQGACDKHGRNTPPLAHDTAITDLVQLSTASGLHAGPATQILTSSSFARCNHSSVHSVVVQFEQPYPTSAFCPSPAKNASLVHLPSTTEYAQPIHSPVTPQVQPADLVCTCMLRAQDLGPRRSAIVASQRWGSFARLQRATRVRTVSCARQACVGLRTEGGAGARQRRREHPESSARRSDVHCSNPVLTRKQDGGFGMHCDIAVRAERKPAARCHTRQSCET